MNVTSLASGKRTTSTLFLTNSRDRCCYLRPPVRKKKTLLQRVACSRTPRICSARELLTVLKGLVLRGYAARAECDRCEGFALRGYTARAECDHCEGFSFAWIRC